MRFLSQVYTIARGSVGGITYTANQFHQLIARARTSPVQPNTTPQSSIKSAFGFASTQWDELTQEERDDWAAYATTVVFAGPLGPYSVPGRNIMMGGLALVNYINASGLDLIVVDTDAPSVGGRLGLANVAPAVFSGVADTGVAVTFGMPETTDYVVLGQRSLGFNPSRGRYQGPWVTSSGQVVSASGPQTGLIEFGGLTEGQAYFMRIRAVVENDPARYSEDFIVRSIATTNPPLKKVKAA